MKALTSGTLALLSLAAGLALGIHHPLLPPLPLVAFGSFAVWAALRPSMTLAWLAALMPLAGLASWSGWITFDEFDLLVLAAATGTHAARAMGRGGEGGPRRHRQRSLVFGLLIAAFALSTVGAAIHGVADAGGFAFGWYQGYREPLNSLRLAKPLVEALLLWPLWLAAARDPAAIRHLSFGLVLGLLLVSLAAIWERAAFPGLLNFSADYRTTALFWEMHVGGAALDGFLAITVPFAVRELVSGSGRWRWTFAMAVALLASYAAATTFSRGVYLALPLGIGVAVILQALQQRRLTAHDRPRHARDGLSRLALVVVFMAAASWLFPTSGYRGLMGLLGVFAMLLPLAGRLGQAPPRARLVALALGAMLAAGVAALSSVLDKGAYVAFVLAGAFTLAAQVWSRRPGASDNAAAGTLAGYLAMAAALAAVALHWGGNGALASGLAVPLVLAGAGLAVSMRRNPAWPDDVRWQGNTLGLLAVLGAATAVVGGGAYMEGRFSTAGTDFAGRLQHWSLSVSMLRNAEDWALGRGLGRFADNYALVAPENMRPGDYRVVQTVDGRRVLRMTGGAEIRSGEREGAAGGDMLRVSQRVGPATGPVRLTLQVRVRAKTQFVAEVCSKHLIYSQQCASLQFEVAPAASGGWQQVQMPLKGTLPDRGDWFAPRLLFFSIGVDSAAGDAEIERIELHDASGRQMLDNADFSQELAHWFFTSDHSHLPWHAKNLGLHLLMEQGWVGCLLLGSLFLGGLWRVALGSGRDHPLAPALAGALVAFVAVGLFDSLLDVPRLACLFLVLLFLAVSSRRPRPAAPPPGRAAGRT